MKLTWRRQSLRPRHRFATSQGGVDEKQTLVVALEHAGVTGLGEIVPSALYGQSLQSSEAALERARGLLGDDPYALESIDRRLLRELDAQRATVDGLTAALLDWVGKSTGLPAWKLLGLDRPSVQTTFTIGVAEPREIVEKVREALDAGYDALKVKIGVEHDQATLAHIRSRFDGPLLLDANEAWTPEEAPARLESLRRFRPTMVEQPLARQHWRELGRLRELRVAPIFVDESCERPDDVVRLAGLVDGINVKLNKCGGVREALRMITLARALQLQVMLGCFVSSSLAIAPALTIASLVDHADLDGALLLADDPFAGIHAAGSRLSLGDAPGLGVRPAAS